ncbi:STAS domain-containing protein [Amycolatopsis jiangsuensis]|uniref:Anti-sigma factor antagonist n=1 Tax=Amycolatopsis jiangsuensis TaxID=1181879 RepID=A0A840J664_9PSEU|nr:STAS domain-containing protein [Amycolatopsis jiangsuensis]MBB4689520.1 anti-anti-sigma factor [Amycolatopsis jiangsuensis]
MSDLIGSPGELSIEREDRSPAVVLTVRGDIDVVTAPKVTAAVTEACTLGPPVLVLDLSAVDFLASAGLTALLSLCQGMPSGTSFRIVAAGRATVRPIELTGLAQSLPLYRTLETALDRE